jgi:hypothetical protein
MLYPALGHLYGLILNRANASAGGRIVALRTTTGASGNPAMRYFVLDHLGSVSVVTDETGAVVTGGRQSYDAWGKQRNRHSLGSRILQIWGARRRHWCGNSRACSAPCIAPQGLQDIMSAIRRIDVAGSMSPAPAPRRARTIFDQTVAVQRAE